MPKQHAGWPGVTRYRRSRAPCGDMQVCTVVRMGFADHVNSTWADGSVTRSVGGLATCCM